MASIVNSERSPYYKKLSGDIKERYDKKIRKCDGVDPYTIELKDTSTNSKDFPAITMHDITDYMIHSVSSYTKQFFDNYKGTEAHKYFESSFVLKIGSKKIDETAIVLGEVRHSQTMNESPLQVWVLANLDGEILCGHCTCIAGLSETCSHVGAICFAIQKIAESRENKSATDVLCQWNVPSFKKVPMSAAKDMNWRFRSRERATTESSFLEYCDSLPSLSDESIDQFVRRCQSVGDDTALATILFPSEKKRRTNLRDEIFLASLYNENYLNKSLSELVEIGKTVSLHLSDEEVKEISRLTVLKVKSKCYLGLRRGRITGSNFKYCCVTNVQDPSITTIRKVINPIKNLDRVPCIKYQNTNKKKAIQQYIRNAVLTHEDFVHNECGLTINPDIPCFAGSPEGLISCSCHGDGCLEIKCLNFYKLEELDEFLTRKPNNILNKFGNRYSLEESHELFYQIQLHININDLIYCDCVIWSPQKAFVVTAYADKDFWRVAMEKALNFHKHVLMPELLGKFYTRKIGLPTTSNEEIGDEDMSLGEFDLLSLEIEILNSK